MSYKIKLSLFSVFISVGITGCDDTEVGPTWTKTASESDDTGVYAVTYELLEHGNKLYSDKAKDINQPLLSSDLNTIYVREQSRPDHSDSIYIRRQSLNEYHHRQSVLEVDYFTQGTRTGETHLTFRTEIQRNSSLTQHKYGTFSKKIDVGGNIRVSLNHDDLSCNSDSALNEQFLTCHAKGSFVGHIEYQYVQSFLAEFKTMTTTERATKDWYFEVEALIFNNLK